MGALFGVIGMLLHAIMEFNMQIPSNAIIAIALMALMTVQLRFATEQYWFNPRDFGKCLLTLMAVTGVVCISAQAWQRGREAIALIRADHLDTYSEEKLDALRLAIQIEPKNYNTTYELAECLRLQSWRGYSDYKPKAIEASAWFARTMELNPYNPFAPLGYGECLDWLGRARQSGWLFKLACDLDPNGNYEAAYQGWHYIQLEQYPQAKRCLEHSMAIYGYQNYLAQKLYDLVDQRMAEAAAAAAAAKQAAKPLP
jgi:hypothetical protein